MQSQVLPPWAHCGTALEINSRFFFSLRRSMSTSLRPPCSGLVSHVISIINSIAAAPKSESYLQPPWPTCGMRDVKFKLTYLAVYPQTLQLNGWRAVVDSIWSLAGGFSKLESGTTTQRSSNRCLSVDLTPFVSVCPARLI